MPRRGMLRIERAAGATVVVSRLAKLRVLAVVGVALAAAALAIAREFPHGAAALAVVSALVAVAGGRSVQARFECERVRVREAIPFHATAERPLSEFAAARVETAGEARLRRAERLSRDWRARSGIEMPAWMIRRETPGVNDQLRRIVLVPRAGEPLAITAWVAEDDLEPARAEIEALLR